MDHQALVAAVTKGRRRLCDDGPGYADLAGWAEDERPGPVALDVTGVREPLDKPIVERRRGPREVGSGGERPVVIAGAQAIRRGLSESLNSLQVPVFTTAAAKGVVDETLPHAAGVWTGVGKGRAPETAIMAAADSVIGVGLCQEEVLGQLPAQLEFDPDDPPTVRWGLDLVAERLGSLRRDLLDRPFGPAHVFDAVERRFGADRVRTVLDTGWFCTVGEHTIRTPRAALHLSSGAGRSMGAGLPTAIGAAFCDPSVPTVAYLGDGGAPMFLAEAQVAREAGLPLLIVLLSDGGFGSILTGALATGRTRKPLTFGARSWGGALQGMGIPGTSADSLGGFTEALAGWDPASGPAWVEARFDESTYQAMVEDLR
jgi:thiamine pyrophosphate-dependent acetolactate synthase large subunit-like protein